MQKNKKILLILTIIGFLCLINSIAYTKAYKEDNSDASIISLSTPSLNKQWEKIWGGVEFLFCEDTKLDSNGNIYVFGVANDNGANLDDLILIKFNSLGNMQWYRTWGGSDSESGDGVVIDSLDNIYIAGSTKNFGAGQYDMVLVKYDSAGVQQWNQTWGTSDSEMCNSLAIDSSNNLFLAGRVGEEIVLVKYDINGNQQWNRTLIFENGYPTVSEILIGSLGDVYIAGANVADNDYYEMILIKLDNVGVHQWNRTWGSSSNWCMGYSVAMDSSDSIYITGEEGLPNSQLILIKLNNSGVQQWNRTWGGSQRDTGFRIVVDSSDNIYILGRTESYGAGSLDVVLMSYDTTGSLKWDQTWGGSTYDYGSGLVLDDEKNIYITGTTRSFNEDHDYQIFIVKYGNPNVQGISGYQLITLFISISALVAIIVYRTKKRN